MKAVCVKQIGGHQMMGNPDQKTLSFVQHIRAAWRIARPHRAQIVRGHIFRAVQTLFLGVAMATGVIATARLSQGQNSSTLIGPVLLVMGVSLLGQILFGYLAVRDTWLGAYRLGRDLRLTALEHLRSLPMSFHLSRHSGDTSTVLTNNIQMIESLFAEVLPRLVQAFGLPFFVFVFLLFVEPMLALALAVPVIIASASFLIASRKLAWLGLERQELQGEAGAQMVEFAQGMGVTRAFGRLERDQARMARAIEAYRDISIQLVHDMTSPMSRFALITMAGIPFMIAVVAVALVLNAVPVTSAILVWMLLLALYSPLAGLLGLIEYAKAIGGAIIRLNRLMTAEPLPTGEVSAISCEGSVTFENVSFGYGPENVVLKDVSFEAPAASLTAIIGPSGAGKSTVLNLIARFWEVDRGQIRNGGQVIRDLSQTALSDAVSFVFQDIHLISGTIRDNILLGRPEATHDQVRDAAKRAFAHRFIMEKPEGYETQIGEGGKRLSGGERQRIAIARALLKNAPILLLDEVTAALDPLNEQAIAQGMAELARDRTVIVVAHKLTTIEAANQILVLEDSMIAERGIHEELLARGGTYERFWSRLRQAEDWTF